MSDQPSPRRSLPSVDRVVRDIGPSEVASDPVLVALVRETIVAARSSGRVATAADIAALVRNWLEDLGRPRLEPTINGTGVILHTNLGRAPVSDETAAAMAAAAASYVPLELDPDTNARGGRMDEISDLMRLLTGAQRTLVVNNNAGALLLSLASLAAGRSVIVARGEAVEIGGGFRVPEVVEQGGCRLLDVGTTNKTRPEDYARSIGPDTGALLKVHPSNFVVDGFTHETLASELASLGHERGVPVVHDIGSGALIDPSVFRLRPEPTFQESIAAGVDIVTASGDKLMGGPQAGVICGRADLIASIERHPLARALRADKSTLAGVAATLRHYLAGNALDRIPVWRMISTSVDELRSRAEHISLQTGWHVTEMRSTVGGGSLPGEEMPSVGLSRSLGVQQLAHELRMGEPRVFGRIHDGRMLIDFRTVHAGQDAALAKALSAVTASAVE